MADAQTKQTADVIYVNGRVFAGRDVELVDPKVYESAAEKMPARGPETVSEEPAFAQAIAVHDGKVLAIGSNAQVNRLKGRGTKVVELKGAFVMPGFNDAHLHLVSGGFRTLTVDLVGAKSLAEMQQRIAAKAKQTPAGEWLAGRGWDHTLWPEAKLPTRQDLDAVTGDHPAIFTRIDGHISVANTAALKAAGITGKTQPPAGGAIDLDEQGEPTGILREGAAGLVERKIPAPSPARRKRAAELALAEAARWGVTSLQDIGEWEDFLVYEELLREGKLTARITHWMPFATPLEVLQAHRARRPQTDPWLRTGPLKTYTDGSLGSRTALLRVPYSDHPKNVGLAQWEQGKLNEMMWERVRAGFQIGVHAIGDKGADVALEAFAESARRWREQNPGEKKDFRFRIEHLQVMAPDQWERMKELGVIASVQTNHLLTDMRWAEQRIGAERAQWSYPWREFVKRGIPLAFGTDYPVEPLTPFRGLYAAVTRKSEDGKQTYPGEPLTIDEAIAAYTSGAAYAEFAEREKGTLAPGMLADFVVLDRDITKAAPAEILKTKVLRTVVGGKTVYQGK